MRLVIREYKGETTVIRDYKGETTVIRDYKSETTVIRDYKGETTVIRDYKGETTVIRDYNYTKIFNFTSFSLSSASLVLNFFCTSLISLNAVFKFDDGADISPGSLVLELLYVL